MAGEFVARLAEHVVNLCRAQGRPVVVGICGAQGSGKSTLALFLEQWLGQEYSTRAATLALDDLYLPRREREELAQTRHPLFLTRGVPGTHDVALGLELLDALTGGEGRVSLPVFDKACDDRKPASEWRHVDAPVDSVLLEGWCVGASAQPDDALAEPVNALEAEEDTDGSWRRQVNQHLRTDYSPLFNRLDCLVYLQVPSFEKVLEWRTLQETKLTGAPDLRKLRRFVSHFERLTRHLDQDMPRRADIVIGIDEEHRLTTMVQRGRRASS